ncbi:MAG TPA: mechanosensitive ion channel domain-containing protein [Candidatus Margulisiibacteriota bacterium]|nr:mechanosensitive ion channel domain-containing protein [Candidatus Margulisiibacteriota bacterium]
MLPSVLPRSARVISVLTITLLAVPAIAAVPGVDGSVLRVWVLSLSAVVAAASTHWGLRRVSRRLPRWLAQRAGRPVAPGGPVPWEGPLELLLLVPKAALWLAVAVYVSGQFMALRQARMTLGDVLTMSLTAPLFTLNDRGYSALDVLELPAVLAVLWVVASGLTRVLKSRVLRSTGLERGAQDAVALLTRYTLVFLGAIVILQVWGIDVRSLALVASVLGVGIGFGLQHIANNFVSGLVVSLERPIQPGDFVKVGEWMGTVERIGPRHTEIRTLDNVSILVPNSRFLETEVINWTHRDPVSRLHVPVGVAYGSNTARVRMALLEAARSHPEVLGDPRPRVEFRGFGDSALNFELHVWTRDPSTQFRLVSDLNYRVEANLRRHQIHVPFPQRDLHLRSPQLEQLLNAWSRRHFTATELAASNGQPPEPAAPNEMIHGPEGFDDVGSAGWTDEQIQTLIARMRAPDGVPITDRRHLLTVYPKCFVGREAVDWLTHTVGLTREEATMVGQLAMDRGAFHHVLDEHGFKDGNFFYRFREDERMQTAPTSPTAP